MYAEADYSEGTTTYMWIMSKIQELAQNIVDEEKSRLAASISDSPKSFKLIFIKNCIKILNFGAVFIYD